MEPPISVRGADQRASEGGSGQCEQSFSTTKEIGGLLALAESDTVAVLDTGATPNLVCFNQLERHNRVLQRKGAPRVSTFPPSARFRFGDGRVGEVPHAADIPAGAAGSKGEFVAFGLEADIPAFSRKGALEALGGDLDFSRDISTLLKQRAEILLRVSRTGHYISRGVDTRLGRTGTLKGARFRPHLLNGPSGNIARIYPMADDAFPMRRMASTALCPRILPRPVRQLHWGMLRIDVCRAPRRLP